MTMRFRHADATRSDYPELAAGALHATGVGPTTGVGSAADVGPRVAEYTARAAGRSSSAA
ncbi:hypothetical protein [Streptomyces sp. NPDC053542]|uniref:hypothetical protein n=1 Tax=Streptomyces sp. NPDC053542 TaxID=3365710 RepID=UPI0037D13A13